MKPLLGALSIASGLALQVAPDTLTTLYGLPRHAPLARLLGARDTVIGLWLLQRDAHRGLVGRALSDLLDFGLIWRERRQRPHSPWSPARLTIALLSASFAASASRSTQVRSHVAGGSRWWPALLVGGAFFLAVTVARRGQASAHQRG